MVIAIDIRLVGKQRTGDEAVFRNLTRALLEADRENEYLLLTDERDPETLESISKRLGVSGGGNAKVIALQGRNRFVWNLISLPLFLLWKEVDIFHTQYILPFFVPERTKVVAHIHDVSFRAFPGLIGPADRLFLALLIPRTMKRADLLVAPSEFTKSEIVKYYGVPVSKVAVVPNAVADDFFHEPTDIDLVRVRRKYRLPERFLLTVGTLQPRKNIPFLLRAFATLHERVSDMSLVVAGNRSAHHYDREIDRALTETHVATFVRFPGFIADEDLPALYRLATGLVFPSRYEGFGIPLLEAFAAGVPAAASDISPFREVGADAALYFHSDDIVRCAEALYTLSTDKTLKERLKDKGRERLDAYSWAESAHVLLSCYRGLFS